ncbi:hypothetical protein HCG51_14865 [Tolypothrix sp. PCC 7910]|uniref:hypothetical protein n=1 Tax=Tolypothrix sp. PCC 7910 TaxID=2099387 RepID=UPI001427816B|nr:hypothetical protein [Tolypothrix sp. PCC 7910]QIR37866.1 hypothetical protein HCG51_14865 [Tolypothrix sp. PCC 7910]
MAAVRKSAVSATGNWFRQDSTPSGGKRRSAYRRSTAPRVSQPAVEPSPVPATRQRRSSKNVSVSSSPTSGLVMPTTVTSGKQPTANLQRQLSTPSTLHKSSRLGFLKLPIMNNSSNLPVWLLRFYTLHRYSSVVTFLLVATTLMVYGWTVYSQELWSQGYRRLQSLQRHERQLTTTNATLTNKMAQEAEQPTAGFVSPTPARTIFLPPANNNPNSTPTETTSNLQTQPPTSSPLGY